jgi:cysteinyl-tRNA synthetase
VVLYLVSGHYRQPLAFGPEQMDEAVARCERLRNFFREYPLSEGPAAASNTNAPAERFEAFKDALADDFNTPKALAIAFELVTEARHLRTPWAPQTLLEMLSVLGLETLAEPSDEADDEAQRLLAEREEARAAKDFERADDIRDRLAELGWEVRDAEGGARLVPKG